MSVDLYFSIKDNATSVLKEILDSTEDLTSALEESKKRVSQYEDQYLELKTGMVSTTKAVRDARKAFQEVNNEANRDNLKKAIAQQEDYRQKISATAKALKEERSAYQTLSSAMDEVGNKQADAVSKLNNRVSAASAGSSALSTLGKAGIAGAVGSILGEGLQAQASAWLTSNMNGRDAKTAGSAIGGALSGATTGAAVGSLFGPLGTAVGGLAGGALGALSGWLSGNAQEKEEFEEYRKSKVQDTFSQVTERYAADTETGKQLAASREQTKLSLQSLLKDKQTASQVYDDVKEMANLTSFSFDELSGVSKMLAVSFKDSEGIMDWMETITDSASAIGLQEADMQEMTRALTKIKNTGYATREDLDMWSDRGIAVYSALAETLGISEGEVFKKISKGEISADTTFQAIQSYVKEEHGGAAKEVGQNSYAGKSATLEGLKADVFQNAYGESYNETRMETLDKQIEFYQGEYGQKISKLMETMGQWDAELENRKDQLDMDNLKAWVDGIDNVPKGMKESMEVLQNVFAAFPKEIGEPLSAAASGIAEGIGNINTSAANLDLQKGTAELMDFSNQLIGLNTNFKESAEELFGYVGQLNGGDVYASYAAMMGKSQIDFFNSSEYQEHNMKDKDVLYAVNKGLADPETTANLQNSLERVMEDGLEGAEAALKRWDGPEILRQQFANVNLGINITPTIRSGTSAVHSAVSQVNSIVKSILPFGNGHASGLTRVPYDNYPALLHQGERVLTAQQVRQGERSSGGVTVTITGNTFTGSSPSDAKSIAEQVAAEVARKLLQASRIAP